MSLLLHGALAIGLMVYAPRAFPPRRSSTIELDVIERTQQVEPTPRSAGSVSAAAGSVEFAKAAPRVSVAPRPRAAAAAATARDEPLPGPLAPRQVDGGPTFTAAPTLAPTDVPRSAPAGGKLDLRLGAGALQRMADDAPSKGPDAPPPTEAAKVKQTVDSLIAEAQVLARPAADGAVQGLGRSFERSAGIRTFTPDVQRWVQSAVTSYREQAHRYGRLGKSIESEWDRIESRAIQDLDRGGQKYVALVEIRQRSDGKLLDLRLVASSGTSEFDLRALGSVARGLLEHAEPLVLPRPEGTMSLWALLGEHQATGAVAVAKKVYRALLLDVEDLKPMVIELDHDGSAEQVRFSARLLAVF